MTHDAGFHRDSGFEQACNNVVNALVLCNNPYIMVPCLHKKTPFENQLSHAERDLATGGLSLRPSHADNASKLMIAGSCGFHRR